MQPLWGVWSAHAARGERPSDATLARTRERIGWRGVTIDGEAIAYDRPGMAMTLNSINQGYAADVVVGIVAAHGIADAFIDTGEFGALGRHPDGRAWRLGVVAPRAPDEIAFTLDPFHRFAATSGDYLTCFSPDFSDHHIFDPRTGRSPPDWSSITVTAPSGLQADGLSTALFTLDAEGCRDLLRRHPRVRGAVLWKGWDRASPRAGLRAANTSTHAKRLVFRRVVLAGGDALAQLILQLERMAVLGEQIAKRFVGELLKAASPLAAQEVDQRVCRVVELPALADHRTAPAHLVSLNDAAWLPPSQGLAADHAHALQNTAWSPRSTLTVPASTAA